jgi:uncharacterized protein Yka (UPF0111/DUF47 family)
MTIMTAKSRILEELGERDLVLPNLVADGLRANDSVKYYMSVLQACREHADHPDSPAVDLRAEREAIGEEDTAFDEAVALSHTRRDGGLFVPEGERLHERLLDGVARMLAPLRAARAALLQPYESYESRLAALQRDLPVMSGEILPDGYVEAVTRAARDGPDSVHLLMMDLHRELNHLQAGLAEETLDGARIYGLSDDDRPLVQAFMGGVNATAALKFDHPGLGTTATRIGERLVIQNDIGTTDSHVLVIHVDGLDLSLVYTDIHGARLQFFQGLLEQTRLTWSRRGSSTDRPYESCIGRRESSDTTELRELLRLLGSRLVFLIDWNRARKRLSRFVKKTEAIAVLRWAADHDYGHRAFLEAGGERLVYDALERTADSQRAYGARLDDILGRRGATTFLQAVLRLTSDALRQHRSLRLVRDEVQAELLDCLRESQQGVLTLAADHAALVVALALALRDGLLRLRADAASGSSAALADRAKRWETRADEIVNHARQAERHVPDSEPIRRLLIEADDVADGLEEAIFLMTLVGDGAPASSADEILRPLASLAASAAQEYVKCLALAADIRRGGTRDDVQQFLVSVDRVVVLEHESDELERRAKAAILQAASDFRPQYVQLQIARAIEESADGLARCVLMLKDHVMGEVLVE